MVPKVLVAALRRATYWAWRRRIRATLDRPDSCAMFGLDLVILPGVLHPGHFASSKLLARYVMGLDLQGKSVVEIGCGSGLVSLLAARGGAEVTAIDINPVAVECTGENARRNGVSGRVSAVASNLFGNLPSHQQFDYALTNPPFYPREPGDLADHAFAAGTDYAFFAKLAAGLPTRLTRGAALLLVQSSDTDESRVSSLMAANGLGGSVVRRKRGLFETLTIREFRLSGSAGGHVPRPSEGP